MITISKLVNDFRILWAEAVGGGVNISNMGPREREEGGFGDLQPVMKKLKLGGEGEKREIEGKEEMVKGEGRGVKRRHHPDTECTGARILNVVLVNIENVNIMFSTSPLLQTLAIVRSLDFHWQSASMDSTCYRLRWSHLI